MNPIGYKYTAKVRIIRPGGYGSKKKKNRQQPEETEAGNNANSNEARWQLHTSPSSPSSSILVVPGDNEDIPGYRGYAAIAMTSKKKAITANQLGVGGEGEEGEEEERQLFEEEEDDNIEEAVKSVVLQEFEKFVKVHSQTTSSGRSCVRDDNDVGSGVDGSGTKKKVLASRPRSHADKNGGSTVKTGNGEEQETGEGTNKDTSPVVTMETIRLGGGGNVTDNDDDEDEAALLHEPDVLCLDLFLPSEDHGDDDDEEDFLVRRVLSQQQLFLGSNGGPGPCPVIQSWEAEMLADRVFDGNKTTTTTTTSASPSTAGSSSERYTLPSYMVAGDSNKDSCRGQYAKDDGDDDDSVVNVLLVPFRMTHATLVRNMLPSESIKIMKETKAHAAVRAAAAAELVSSGGCRSTHPAPLPTNTLPSSSPSPSDLLQRMLHRTRLVTTMEASDNDEDEGDSGAGKRRRRRRIIQEGTYGCTTCTLRGLLRELQFKAGLVPKYGS